jgi:RNA polymerase sigma factor (sigma-70 family)
VPDTIDLPALCRGDKASWDRFVKRYAGLIHAAVRGAARPGTESEDLAQEVFTRLCKDDYRLLKTYDPARAGLSTWLTIVSRSTARDVQRRRQIGVTPIDNVPEILLAVHDEPREKVQLPAELLSVRSTHHKAMLKLRTHFAVDEKRAKN